MREDYQFTKSVVLRLLNDFYESKTGETAKIEDAANFLYDRKKKEQKVKDYEVLDWFEPNDDKIEYFETAVRIKKIRRISDGVIFEVGGYLYKTNRIIGIIKHGYEVSIIATDIEVNCKNIAQFPLRVIK